MSVVGAFRALYLVFRVFCIFPYGETPSEEFRLCEDILVQGRYTVAVLFVIRAVIFALDVRYNFYSTSMRVMMTFRSVNTLCLHVLSIVAYGSVLRFARTTCDRLNDMARLYASIRGNVRSVLLSNRLLLGYSVAIFWVTHLLVFVALRTNFKFLSDGISLSDSLCFMLFLMIQNVYLCQLLTFVRWTALSFARINEILREEERHLRTGTRFALSGRLRILRARHLAVMDFFDYINSVFQFNLLLHFTWVFFSVVFCSVSVVLFDLCDAVILLLWTTYHPFQNLPIIYLCEMVRSESEKSLHLAQELQLQVDDPEIKEEVEIFSLQLQQRPAAFSICGFFQLEFKLVYSICGVVTMYIIALFQIQPTSIYNGNETLVNV